MKSQVLTGISVCGTSQLMLCGTMQVCGWFYMLEDLFILPLIIIEPTSSI